MKANHLLFILTLSLLVPARAGTAEPDPCDRFFRVLKAVPNETLFRADGALESLRDGKAFHGCEVRLVTNDALLSGGKSVPDFCAGEGTDLHNEGWRRNPSYDADGPGTSLHGIENDDWLCLVSTARPASVEAPYVDGRGTVKQSETLAIVVQCRKK